MPKTYNRKAPQAQRAQQVKQQQLPPMPELPSLPGPQDKIINVVYVGGLALSAVTMIGFVWFTAMNFQKAVSTTPTDWMTVVMMLVVTVIAAFTLRALVWASFAGSVMLANHLKAFHSQEVICKRALKYRKLIPGGTIWAVHALMAQMVQRGQFKELIPFGTAEYEAYAKKDSKDQNLAPLCAYLGMAHQVLGDAHASILWNERALELFQKALAPLEKLGKDQKVPQQALIDNMIMQYAGSYANLGASYFGVGNYGKAKKNFQLSLEQLERVKDNPQKQQLQRGIQEHMGRLKHW